MKKKRLVSVMLIITTMLAVIAAGCRTERIDGEYTNTASEGYSQNSSYAESKHTESKKNSDTDIAVSSREESQKTESSSAEPDSANSQKTESKEESEVTLESVEGKTLDEAKKYLDSKGLKYNVKEEYSDSVENGKIISQNPSADTKVKEGSEVEIIVSKGAEPKEEPKAEEPKEEESTPAPVSSNIVQIPDVVGKTFDNAANEISALGLYYTASYSFDKNVPKGTVISQTPGGGTEAAKGSRVTMVVSDGAEPEQVTTYYEYTITENDTANNQGGDNTVTYSNGPEYVGFWYSFRPYINIECNDGVNYEINARWSSSATIGVYWHITAAYNPVTDRLEYSNGKYYYYEYSTSGKEKRTLLNSNTSGYLKRYSDSELYWYDSADSSMSSDPFKKQ